MIIEAATGNSVETEMNSRIIKPLNLDHTYYLPYAYNEDILSQLVHGYWDIPGSSIADVTKLNISWADAAWFYAVYFT